MDELYALMAREETSRQIVLPVLHNVTRERLAQVLPLLADRMNASTTSGLPAVVSEILKRVGPKHPVSSASIAVDLSHGQVDWRFFPACFQDHPERFTLLHRGTLEERDILERSAVLLMALPRRHRLTTAEIDHLDAWVASGKGLLLMGYYDEAHHETNVSELARRFDLEFGANLVMPGESQEADTRAQVGSRSVDYAVGSNQPTASIRSPLESRA